MDLLVHVGGLDPRLTNMFLPPLALRSLLPPLHIPLLPPLHSSLLPLLCSTLALGVAQLTTTTITLSMPLSATHWICWMGTLRCTTATMSMGSSRRRVFSLDSPPKVVGHKRQHAGSPSPPRIDKNSFVLLQKVQTPMYHSHAAFMSGSQVLRKPSLFASPSGMSRSRSSPSSTASSLPYISSDYRLSPTASQTSFFAKPQSSTGSKKKTTSVADMEGHISMLNDEIQSMHSDMSERRELKNERP